MQLNIRQCKTLQFGKIHSKESYQVMVIYRGKKKLIDHSKVRLNESSAQHSFGTNIIFIEYLRVEMQERDSSYVLSCCITSVIPSWGAGVPLSRLVFGENKRQEKNNYNNSRL